MQKSEEDLNEQEEKDRADLEAVNELLNYASSKLIPVLSSTPLNRQSITVAQMMLETAKTKHQQTMDSLDKIRKKQKFLDKTTHSLLEKALPSKEMSEKKRKHESEKNCDKKLKTKPLGKNYKVQTFW